MSQLPFGWVCFSNGEWIAYGVEYKAESQLPFGWVCFSNAGNLTYAGRITVRLNCLSAGSVSLTRFSFRSPSSSRLRLNCLSAGSVSLTAHASRRLMAQLDWSQLPFGWVCFSNSAVTLYHFIAKLARSQLPFGWVCFSNVLSAIHRLFETLRPSQLPFGWVCFSNVDPREDWRDEWKCLNCLSAGSVSLTSVNSAARAVKIPGLNCLSAGSVSLTTHHHLDTETGRRCLNCLSAGSVSLTLGVRIEDDALTTTVSIAFRLGLFL